METIKCESYRTIEDFNKRIKEHKTIAFDAVGYYIARGGTNSFELKIPIFAFESKPDGTYKALIEFIGSMCWINVVEKDIFFGGCVGLHYSTEGKLIRKELEKIIY
jgi:hypothetical protein